MQKLKNFRCRDAGNNRGSVLIGVIGLAIVMGVACLGYLQLSAGTANMEITALREDDAFWAAESGLLIGAEWLGTAANAANAQDLFDGYSIDDIAPNYAENGYDVQVDIAKDAGNLVIRSTAYCNANTGYNKVLMQNVEANSGPPFDPVAFDHVILTDGDLDYNGSGDITDPSGTNPKVHSNQAMDIKNDITGGIDISSSVSISVGNDHVEANLTSPNNSIHKNATGIISVTTQNPVPEIPFPDVDLSLWRKHAEANSEVHSGTWTTSNYTPAGGVLWIDGDVHISNAGTINGQVIATGDIKMSGGSINAPDGGFALATVTGDIELQTQGAIKGLVYAKAGDFKQTSGGNLQGQIIIKGNIAKGGNSDIMVYKYSEPSPPDGNGWPRGVTFVSGTWSEQNIVP